MHPLLSRLIYVEFFNPEMITEIKGNIVFWQFSAHGEHVYVIGESYTYLEIHQGLGLTRSFQVSSNIRKLGKQKV